jgi:hypothetical protein
MDNENSIPEKQTQSTDLSGGSAQCLSECVEASVAGALEARPQSAASPQGPTGTDRPMATTKLATLMAKVQEFRARYPKWDMALFFFGGFVYDVLSQSRIDDGLTLAQNFVYLLVLAGLLLLEQRYPEGAAPPKVLARVWRWREECVHFLFGSLLSVFMLLLFKSTSGVMPYLFVASLFALLVANELPRFRAAGPVIRVVLLSLCVTMYLSCLLPVLIGRMGFWVFLLAVALGCASVYGLMRLVRRWNPDAQFLVRNVAIPGFGVQGALLMLYLIGVVPPLPVNVQFAGIYHDVKRISPDAYRLSFVDDVVWYRPTTWFGPDFLARQGDKPYFFFRIFAPKGFAPYKVRVRWYHDHPDHGWTTTGNGFLTTVSSNGTDGGYRYFATTSTLKPGNWRVVLETEAGHEIHRLSFSVGLDERSEPREFVREYSVLKEVAPLSAEEWQKRRKTAEKSGAAGGAGPLKVSGWDPRNPVADQDPTSARLKP